MTGLAEVTDRVQRLPAGTNTYIDVEVKILGNRLTLGSFKSISFDLAKCRCLLAIRGEDLASCTFQNKHYNR